MRVVLEAATEIVKQVKQMEVWHTTDENWCGARAYMVLYLYCYRGDASNTGHSKYKERCSTEGHKGVCRRRTKAQRTIEV